MMIKTDVIIIGAGPVGLFAVHQLGIKGLKSEIIDNIQSSGKLEGQTEKLLIEVIEEYKKGKK